MSIYLLWAMRVSRWNDLVDLFAQGRRGAVRADTFTRKQMLWLLGNQL